MSMNNLSVDGEFRYIIQWFNEWSELQRDDFVYVMVEYLARVAGEGGNGNVDASYVNGVVHSLATSTVQDKPMSLFQCRIKLFREWSPKWPIEFKCKLQEKINELDEKVGEKIFNELKKPHSMHNGDVSVHLNVNGTSGSDDNKVEQSTEEAAALPSSIETQAVPAAVNDVVDQTLEIDNDNHLAAVLRQETPVDDDDDQLQQPQQQQLSGNDCNSDTNGIYASSASVTTIVVNASPAAQQTADEPVEQVENNVSASVIVSVATAPEVVPVA